MSLAGALALVHDHSVKNEKHLNSKIKQVQTENQKQESETKETKKQIENQQHEIEQLKKDVQAHNDRKKAVQEASQKSFIAKAVETVVPSAHAAPSAPSGGLGGIAARIRMHESGGNYATNTGNGYYGAYQFDVGTWGGYGGYTYASDAPPGVQDAKFQEVYAARGCSPWPNTCY